jgi:hypothetical protein
MRLPAALLAVLASAVVLAGCSQVVSGVGRNGLTPQRVRPSAPGSSGPAPGSSGPSAPGSSGPSAPGSSGPSAPGSSGPSAPSPQPQASSCPHVVYPSAGLSFDCITSGLTTSYTDPVWPVSEQKTVEQSTGWVLEEGAGHWGSPGGSSLAAIAQNVRDQMISVGGYGTAPTVYTVANQAMTVDGAAAHLLQTTVDINRAWARQAGTKVKQEKLWIVAIRVGPNDVSLWYTSLPDLAASLWPKVPATIASIKVG